MNANMSNHHFHQKVCCISYFCQLCFGFLGLFSCLWFVVNLFSTTKHHLQPPELPRFQTHLLRDASKLVNTALSTTFCYIPDPAASCSYCSVPDHPLQPICALFNPRAPWRGINFLVRKYFFITLVNRQIAKGSLFSTPISLWQWRTLEHLIATSDLFAPFFLSYWPCFNCFSLCF